MWPLLEVVLNLHLISKMVDIISLQMDVSTKCAVYSEMYNGLVNWCIISFCAGNSKKYDISRF